MCAAIYILVHRNAAIYENIYKNATYWEKVLTNMYKEKHADNLKGLPKSSMKCSSKVLSV